MKFARIVCLLVSAGIAGTVAAADPFYIGSWTFAAAVVAPWADAQRKPDDTERARLMGKTVVLKAKEISGPRPFACARPQYKVTDYGPDMIFQGGLTDPAKQAAALGYKDATITTLETGCEGAIDFHFLDQNTAMFALNNWLYKLEHKKP